MRQRNGTIIITLLGLACANRAWAFRPVGFSDADVAESRTIEFEIAPVEYLKRGEFRAVNAPNLAITFGIGRGFEFGVEAVNRVALEPDVPTADCVVDCTISCLAFLSAALVAAAGVTDAAAGAAV